MAANTGAEALVPYTEKTTPSIMTGNCTDKSDKSG